MVSNECPTIDQILCRDNSVSQTSSIAANDLADYFEISSVREMTEVTFLDRNYTVIHATQRC